MQSNDIPEDPFLANANVGPESPVSLVVDMAKSINYASWQNSVPMIRAIRIENRGESILNTIRLEFSVSPAFAKSKIWTIDRLQPGETVSISDRMTELDPDYLSGLNEAERGDVSFKVMSGDQLLAELHEDARLLARDEWGGFDSMGNLLAAFVMPNDPAVATIIKHASTVLANYGHPTGLDGYQTADPRRAYMLAAAVWSSIAAHRLTYAEPPKSFEKSGQKIRRPSTILEQGLSTCLDSSLLLCSALEACGLNPVILIVDGHALAGVWLVKKTFGNLLETDAAEVRKAIAARELITFETTLLTQNPPSMFEDAEKVAKTRTSEMEEDKFVAALDIARARMNQIRPMASHVKAVLSDQAAAESLALPLPKLPDFSKLPDLLVEEKPKTAAGRIDRWQRKLLDLSLRNRLLNFKDGKQAVPFLCPDVPFLEDRLATAARMRIISLPEQNPLGQRDANVHLLSTGKDINVEFALEALQRDELSSPLAPKELDARLIDIYRRAQNDLAEGGSNTLFLAVGFLKWKKTPDDTKTYRAPLLLVPVKLERRSAASRFHILHHEDEVRFNATLLQLLKRDFDLNLPQFDGALPTDESGIDVPLVLEMVRRAVRDVSGFEVINETALSTFSFAKYLMWKDLVDRTDSLRENRVVKHLIDNPEAAFVQAVSTAFPQERDVDKKYAPAQLISLLPADSSQLAATMAAVEGHDFVLIGPPGTGKSQTIANMIAQCLAAKKSVLFVAEKTAALDVVYRRLKEHGLGPFCLELHSNKAQRKPFVEQLKSSWEARKSGSGEEWIEINSKLRIKRDELNAYVDALHRKSANGMSIFDAMGLHVKGKDHIAPELLWPNTVQHDQKGFEHIRAIVGELAATFRAVRPLPALAHINALDWSPSWENDLLKAAGNIANAAKDMQMALFNFTSQLGIEGKSDCLIGDIDDLSAMSSAIHATASGNYKVIYAAEFEELKNSISDIETAISLFKGAANQLNAVYQEDDIERIPADELDLAWRHASALRWPKSMLEKRKIQKLLGSFSVSGTADPENDLPKLRIMKTNLAKIRNSSLGQHVPQWNGVLTDTAQLRQHFEIATLMRASVVRLGKLAGNRLRQIVQTLAPYLTGTGTEHPLRGAATNFDTKWQNLREEISAYKEIANGLPFEGSVEPFLAQIINVAKDIRDHRTILQTWTSWCAVKQKAVAHGLTSFTTALEAGDLKPDNADPAFLLSYVRWWLPTAIGSDPVIRQFKRFRHEDTLADFRKLDDLARGNAASQVQRMIARDLPQPNEVPRASELGLLRHQIGLQKPSKSIREMIGAMPESFGKLAPCLLMSPLSIAQYLPAKQALFDIVIFDEASQITTWDAIGALARGRQAVIVGDPKQLPPTNFFGRADDEDAESEVSETEKDLESILDEAKVSGLRVLELSWHYRSKHESLIAFSNWHYYGNRLITFPSPVTQDRAVSLQMVKGAVYDRGKSRTNKVEAEAIAKDATVRMLQWLKLEESQRPTLGVITFNGPQQSLIEDLLDQKRRENPEIEWFFASERVEPTVVKNLENVQGDERDVMLFSITFGPDQAGKMAMSFGAINKDGGERRLNVAVTRARQELVVYSTITAERIDASSTKSVGVQHLKTFLDFAERGAIALPAADKGSVGTFDSPFEEAVAEALNARGWIVVPQVGVSGFRVDLGIVHPDLPGAFIAGVECDGATYHRSATARDRDKIREQVLRGLGWEIIRVWSPDWWYDKVGATDRLNAALDDLLQQSRQKILDLETNVDAPASDAETTDIQENKPEDIENAGLLGRTVPETGSVVALDPLMERSERKVISPDNANRIEALAPPTALIADRVSLQPAQSREEELHFRRVDLSAFQANPEAFFEFNYRHTLEAMIACVMAAEAPMRLDVLAQRIARAHGWLRTGPRIRERIELHLRNYDRSEDSAGQFLWLKDSIKPLIPWRAPATEDDRRPVSDVPLAELAGFILGNKEALDEPDPALVIARELGLERLAATSRSRIDEAIALALSLLD
jgi:very-short-patch-repair endonuclease